MRLDIIVEARLILDARKLRGENPTAFKTLKESLKYKNSKWVENDRYGYSNHGTNEFLRSYELLDNMMLISRGARDKVANRLSKFNIQINWVDRTHVCPSVSFEHSKTVLRSDQSEVMDLMLPHEQGGLEAYTSFGKTLFALEHIRRLGQPAMIIVHTTFLQEQWIAEATNSKLFNLPMSRIGGVGGRFSGKKRCLGDLNVCLYHSLQKSEHLAFFEGEVGVVYFDEGQKSPIEGIQGTVNKMRARYRFAVSAKFERKDGKQDLTYDTFGAVIHKVEEAESDSKILSSICIVPTNYENREYDINSDYNQLMLESAVDRERNIFICKRAIRHVNAGRLVVILVERKIQAGILAKYLSHYRVDMLLGPTNWKSYHLPHVKQAWIKKKGNLDKFPEYQEACLSKVPNSALRILKDYDDKTSFDRVNKLASKKKLDIVIGTSKIEVGLSIRTLDVMLIPNPLGNNIERFNQVVGRVERKYKSEDIEYFGREKEIPIVELLKDRHKSSRNSAQQVQLKYGKRVRFLKTT